MASVTRESILKDAAASKVTITDLELDYLVDEVNKFLDEHPEIDVSNVNSTRYVNSEVVNVFSAKGEELAKVEDVLLNVKDREGNYVKVPKVVK